MTCARPQRNWASASWVRKHFARATFGNRLFFRCARLSAQKRLGRALIRLTVGAEDPRSGGPRRGYRRIEWIERVLEPVRGNLTHTEFNRLVSALSVLMGWEPLIVLKDVRGLEQKEAAKVLAFAVRAVVDAALRASR